MIHAKSFNRLVGRDSEVASVQRCSATVTFEVFLIDI